jgi:flagellar motor switch protein FliN
MADQLSGTDIPSFSRAFASALVNSMTAAGPSPWQMVAASDAPVPDSNADGFQVKFTLEGSLKGELVLELDSAGACLLASAILGKTTKKIGAPQSQALLKLVGEAGNSFCSAVAEKYGAFSVEAAVISGPMSSEFVPAYFSATSETSTPIAMTIFLDPGLAVAVDAPAGATSSETSGAMTNPLRDQINLGLVMDVELNVTLRFGQRLLTLREVLDLTSGSVVELDRQVEEPVELLLEGKVIARGEAVVIDGNYGLRVTDVPQPISSETFS